MGGYAAIDQGRNQMATDALAAGFEETFWIDSDIEFHCRRRRAPRGPTACRSPAAFTPAKRARALSSQTLPGTTRLGVGQGAGLSEILYAGAGFLHVRCEVYRTMQERLALPTCNEHFGRPMVPFFQPMVLASEAGPWYLAEDYAFCERARQCGFKIMADTSIRLWHIGEYAYGWEDAARNARGATRSCSWSPGRKSPARLGPRRPRVAGEAAWGNSKSETNQNSDKKR